MMRTIDSFRPAKPRKPSPSRTASKPVARPAVPPAFFERLKKPAKLPWWQRLLRVLRTIGIILVLLVVIFVLSIFAALGNLIATAIMFIALLTKGVPSRWFFLVSALALGYTLVLPLFGFEELPQQTALFAYTALLMGAVRLVFELRQNRKLGFRK